LIKDNLQSRVCPECRGVDIVYDLESGEQVCSGCGLVILSLKIDDGPEWRAFSQEERESRTRASLPLTPVTSTLIGSPNRDSRGNQLSQPKTFQMIRLQQLQKQIRTQGSMERNLSQAITELDGLISKLHLSNIVHEEAIRIYQQALERDLVKGRSINDMVAASLYAACRLTGVPRALTEVSEYSSISKREIARSYRIIQTELNMDIPNPDARQRIPRIADSLGMSEKVQRKAVEILTAAKNARITLGKHPVGLAASALYLAGILCGEKVTQEAISEASGVTEVTIRNVYHELKEFIHSKNLI
jgi:transcription initiation factor TFIIB